MSAGQAAAAHLEQQHVVQELLGVEAVPEDLADPEPLLRGLPAVQVVGPEHHAHQVWGAGDSVPSQPASTAPLQAQSPGAAHHGLSQLLPPTSAPSEGRWGLRSELTLWSRGEAGG